MTREHYLSLLDELDGIVLDLGAGSEQDWCSVDGLERRDVVLAQRV